MQCEISLESVYTELKLEFHSHCQEICEHLAKPMISLAAILDGKVARWSNMLDQVGTTTIILKD